MATIYVKKDYKTIQEAIDAANPGDKIIVENGVYRESLNINKNDLKLVGGEDTVLYGDFALQYAFYINNANKIEIQNFKIKNYALWAFYIENSSNVLVYRCSISDVSYVGAEFYNSKNIKFIKNRMSGFLNYGVYSYGSCGGSINYNTIESCGQYGIYITGDMTEFSIIRNNVSRNNNGGIICMGEKNMIFYNKVFKNTGSAISAYSNSSVKGNILSDNTGDGVISSGKNSVIAENLILNNAQNGIYISIYGMAGTKITSNRIQCSGVNGIYIGTGSNIIEGNTVIDSGRYDILRLHPNNEFKNNIFNTSNPAELNVRGE
ncbi:MAG: right-handed parallel beta-helix repeat-containing protein [Bacillota bacterium]|nr:right-handed parallel beta-helix repeat-containing protein [Bacillota bacterium]